MKTTILALAPGVALGLYFGRLLSELWAELAGSTALPLAFGLTLVAITTSIPLTRKVRFAKSWPALLLLFYALNPEANWSTALVVGLFSLLVWLQIYREWPIPLKSSWVAPAAAFCFSLLFFLLYLFTLAPDILPADSGEFQVVAANLGVAHPPGFSLYTMLAHLMTRLPIGSSLAYRVNLFSAFSSMFTLTLVYLAAYALTKRHLAAVISVAALGTATTFWAQATTANIRSLSAFFAAAMFFSLLVFYNTTNGSNGDHSSKKADHYLILFALAFGFGIAHHASLVFIGAISVIFILLIDPSLIRSPSRWWRPFLAFLLGLLPLLYLVTRASSGARGTSPELATWPGFLEHVLALGFRGDLFTYLEPTLLWERIKIMGNVLTFQLEPLFLLGMTLGLVLLLWRDWRLAFLLGGTFLVQAFITATYRAPQTVEYMLPAYIPLALLLGYAAGYLARTAQITDRNWFRRVVPPVVLSLFLVTVIWQFNRHLPSFQQLHSDRAARDYAQPILEDAPADAVILADWHWVTPFWYLQEVEGRRQDVTVRFVFPEGEPYGETWARRIQEELASGHSVISTHNDPDTFDPLPTPEPIYEALLFRQDPRLNLPAGFTSIDTVIGDRIQLLGYGLEQNSIQIADEARLTLAWKPLVEGRQLSLFAHLVGSDGQLYAQEDLPAGAQQKGITLTQFSLTPRIGAKPGEYVVMVGAAASETLLNDDGQERTMLSSLLVSNQDQPLATTHQISRNVAGDSPRRLIGYDWDNTLPESPRLYLHWRTGNGYMTDVTDDLTISLPPFTGPWGVVSDNWSSIMTPGKGNFVPLGQGIIWRGEQLNDAQKLSPGQNMTWSQRFLSSQPVMRDYAISTRLIGFEEDGYHWAWWDLEDAIPAMGAIPTLKWIAGSQVRSPHFVSVDPSAAPGQLIGGALNLYDAITGRALPILDERLAVGFGWIPLGSTTLTD